MLCVCMIKNGCRFVLATAAIGAAYTLIQLPFDIYYACTRKRLIRNGCMPEFDFYADKVRKITLIIIKLANHKCY